MTPTRKPAPGAGSKPELASSHRAAFYADIARGAATMDAACAWIRAEFDDRLRADMLRARDERNRKMEEVA